jgi:hypothetical protein
MALATALGLFTPSANAFCRTKTCAAKGNPPCVIDPVTLCNTNGASVYWPVRSFKFWVDPLGSPKTGISGEAARGVLEQALAAWSSAACKGGPPSISVASVELMPDEDAVVLALSEPDGGTLSDPPFNTSVLTFVDQDSTLFLGGIIALTTVSFGTKSGRVVGADIEVDSANHALTLSDSAPSYDLLSVLTHESGHVLGLDHTLVDGATMYREYNGPNERDPLALRTLEADDIAGICEIYPPGRFDSGGCSCGLSARRTRAPLLALVVGCSWLGLRRRGTKQRFRARSGI